MLTSELPIVFMSYDEPWADGFFADLKYKYPAAKRVHGVKGLDACHKAAAEEAGERWFITVDADALVDPAFFRTEIPEEFLSDTIRVDWPSRNVVNGLTYGNGSLKCWPRKMVRDMQTHEASPENVTSLDHDVGKNTGSNPDSASIQLPASFATTHPAETAYHAFRCGFREGFRMSNSPNGVGRGRGFFRLLPKSNMQRLKVWCSVGSHAPNGNWLIYGARLGLLRSQTSEMERPSINSFEWFESLWNDILMPRFQGSDGHCVWRGDTWDQGLLEEESEGLRRRIVNELDFEIFNATPESSAFLDEMLRECLSPSLVDSLGNMYLTGSGLPRDPAKALRCFEIGKILNLSSSYNNVARMHHKGNGVVRDIDAAIANYEVAIELENEYAPAHLARLLGEFTEKTPERDAHVARLVELSRERGFNVAPAGQDMPGGDK